MFITLLFKLAKIKTVQHTIDLVNRLCYNYHFLWLEKLIA